MTSFNTSPTLPVWRAVLALAVVFVMLATTGWTAVRHHGGPRDALEAELTGWRKERVGTRALPSPDSPPQRIAAFFASIGSARQHRLADRFPRIVGNLNGAPVSLRYRANRSSLGATLKMEGERLRKASSRLTREGRHTAARRLHRFRALMAPDRQILAFDPSGSGKVAEVFGDLDRAERVSVVVPGVDTNLLTFQRTARKYTAPVGMAQSLYAAEQAAAPGARTAVIAWADYTAPVGIGMDSAIGRLAESGAVRLTALTEALPGDSEVALFCHSYGSVVCGVAARGLPPRVTDLAVAGSPGMRAENVAGLGTRARVWAMRDEDDWIEDVPHLAVGGLGHGEDPVAPDFGARVLSAAGAVGHAGYFKPGTGSVENFAAIGVGSYGDVECAPGHRACRSGISGAKGI
ncbi:alpha/beta hydrolase [Streptomyces sp. HNM0663]|uniref:Alpha/beta hydrolase n=1 Tax=Streptomyces chengmaiensis TaxID=3040919 RepID=A0ABT6HKQ7_9ACTN|nr:alpha/beta hydrolase [Streptomyces chengmaiensis]MDH2389323.1 alpha/beta hydrolase [Streptomyces chengmaiensis]